MGVLETDEGVRPDDLDEMYEMWQKLLKMGEQAQRNGLVGSSSW